MLDMEPSRKKYMNVLSNREMLSRERVHRVIVNRDTRSSVMQQEMVRGTDLSAVSDSVCTPWPVEDIGSTLKRSSLSAFLNKSEF